MWTFVQRIDLEILQPLSTVTLSHKCAPSMRTESPRNKQTNELTQQLFTFNQSKHKCSQSIRVDGEPLWLEVNPPHSLLQTLFVKAFLLIYLFFFDVLPITQFLPITESVMIVPSPTVVPLPMTRFSFKTHPLQMDTNVMSGGGVEVD